MELIFKSKSSSKMPFQDSVLDLHEFLSSGFLLIVFLSKFDFPGLLEWLSGRAPA
jgi:hypothetical protein